MTSKASCPARTRLGKLLQSNEDAHVADLKHHVSVLNPHRAMATSRKIVAENTRRLTAGYGDEAKRGWERTSNNNINNSNNKKRNPSKRKLVAGQLQQNAMGIFGAVANTPESDADYSHICGGAAVVNLSFLESPLPTPTGKSASKADIPDVPYQDRTKGAKGPVTYKILSKKGAPAVTCSSHSQLKLPSIAAPTSTVDTKPQCQTASDRPVSATAQPSMSSVSLPRIPSAVSGGSLEPGHFSSAGSASQEPLQQESGQPYLFLSSTEMQQSNFYTGERHRDPMIPVSSIQHYRAVEKAHRELVKVRWTSGFAEKWEKRHKERDRGTQYKRLLAARKCWHELIDDVKVEEIAILLRMLKGQYEQCIMAILDVMEHREKAPPVVDLATYYTETFAAQPEDITTPDETLVLQRALDVGHRSRGTTDVNCRPLQRAQTPMQGSGAVMSRAHDSSMDSPTSYTSSSVYGVSDEGNSTLHITTSDIDDISEQTALTRGVEKLEARAWSALEELRRTHTEHQQAGADRDEVQNGTHAKKAILTDQCMASTATGICV